MSKRIMMVVMILVVGVMLTPNDARAGSDPVPTSMTFQGRITDGGGQPVTTPVNLRFYIKKTTDGEIGLPDWDSGTVSVTPNNNGIVDVVLGSGGVGPALTANIFSGHPLYLHIMKGTSYLGYQQLHTVPYAFHAAVADSLAEEIAPSPWSESGGNVYREAGNVGIGTTIIPHTLTVRDEDETTVELGLSSSQFGAIFGIDKTNKYSYIKNWDWENDYTVALKQGKVGIGTTAPVDELHLHSSGGEIMSPWIRLTNDNTGNTAADGARFGISSSGDVEIRNYEVGKKIAIYPASNGRVDFFGDVQAEEGLLVVGGSGNPLYPLIWADSNKIGVGTKSPKGKLHIVGNIYLNSSDKDIVWAPGQTLQIGQSYDGEAFTERLSILNDGRVGVGGHYDNYQLNVKGALFDAPTGPSPVFVASNPHPFRAANKDNSTCLHVDANRGASVGIRATPPERGLYVYGRVGIGTADTASAKLQVVGGSAPAIMGYSTGDHAIIGSCSEPERAAINGTNSSSNGFGVIGFNSNTGAYGHLGSKKHGVVGRAASGGYAGLFEDGAVKVENLEGDANHQVYATAAGELTNYSSDIRKKTNLVQLSGALARVVQLKGYSFDWKEKPQAKKTLGLVAQEVEPLFPEAVYTDNQGYLGINYDQLSAVFVEAIKELKAENDALKAEIETLKAKVK